MSFSISASRSNRGVPEAIAGSGAHSAATSVATSTRRYSGNTPEDFVTFPPPSAGVAATPRRWRRLPRRQLWQRRGGSPVGGAGAGSAASLLDQPVPPAAARVCRLLGHRQHILVVIRRRHLGRCLAGGRAGSGGRLLEHPFLLAFERDARFGLGGRQRGFLVIGGIDLGMGPSGSRDIAGERREAGGFKAGIARPGSESRRRVGFLDRGRLPGPGGRHDFDGL